MPRLLAGVAVAAAVTAVTAGCGTNAKVVKPLRAFGGIASGTGSNLWGDSGSRPEGMKLGCISGRRFALYVTVQNRSGKPITIMRGAGPQPQSKSGAK